MATLVGQRIVVEKTYAQMAALILAAELNPFLWYKITDRGDRGLVFRAAAVDRLESTGIRYMLCPATYATGADAYSNVWIGVWNSVKQATATEGQLCIWNGLVWVADAVLSGDSPDTEASGWTVIPKASFTNHEYVEMIFGVTYDFENDWINEQLDNVKNIFGSSKEICYALELISSIEAPEFNPVDVCDWNYATSGVMFAFNKAIMCKNNNVGGDKFIYNNSILINNVNCGGDLSYNNVFSNLQNVLITGAISNNLCTNIIDVSEIGTVNIQFNTNANGSITGVFDANVTDVVVDKTGTAEATTTAP